MINNNLKLIFILAIVHFEINAFACFNMIRIGGVEISSWNQCNLFDCRMLHQR
jgi:hypothetical protein